MGIGLLLVMLLRLIMGVVIVIAVALVAIYGGIQLVEALRGSDMAIAVEPAGACAFTASGHPVDVDISVTRGGKVVATKTIEKLTAGGISPQRYLSDIGVVDAEQEIKRIYEHLKKVAEIESVKQPEPFGGGSVAKPQD